MFQSDTEHLFGVRVDTGVQEGGEIPIHYDSMIAKLIVHGRDRNDAIAKMRDALNGFVIRGINSNIPFQSALLAHPDFVAGQFNTGFIAEHFSKGFTAESVSHTDPDFLIALAAFVRRKSRERAASLSGQLPGYDVKVGQTYTVITLDAKGHHGYTQVEVDDVGGRGTAVIKVNDKSYFNTTRISATARVGYGNFSIFSSYALSTLFKTSVAADIRPLQIGISLGGL
jgi:propionyl-CoA carboxylase alpha chain